jgi:predicted TIM-barrel fold metal-dependent hydrolase
VLIDVHAHFFTERSGRADWQEVNEARLEAGDRLGITCHVASILGSWGAASPTYFPSPDDVTHANARMLAIAADHPGKVYGYCVLNPNCQTHALAELESRLDQGMVGVKLAASRRADDPLLDPIVEAATARSVPILHHIWQHRRKDWPGQEASDAVELATLAHRHPRAKFVLAHIGGGGDWAHTLRAVQNVGNVWVDLSGSGVDTGMLEAVLETVGPQRIVWGTDVTMDTGLAKLRYLESLGLPEAAMAAIRHGNAEALFPAGIFSGDH